MNASATSLPQPVRARSKKETVTAARMELPTQAHPPACVRALKLGTLATLRLALSVYQAPQRAATVRDAALPDAEFDLLLQCAGGGEVLHEVAAVLSTPPQTLQAALDFYLEQALFASGTNAWRTLGLQPGADARDIRTHLQLARHWLERTRAHNPLGALYQARLRQAQHALRRGGGVVNARARQATHGSLLQRLLHAVL